MKFFKIIFGVLVVLIIQDSRAYQTSQKIENFTLINAIDNKSVSLADFAQEKGVVLIFTSNYCPYAKLYEDRIMALADEYNGRGVQFVLINSNTSQDNIDDTIEEMARHAKERGYRFPYLADKEQKAAGMLGATKTPEVFVLQNNGAGNFVLKYRGAIDDNPQVSQEVTANYLKDAILSMLNRKNLSVVEKRPIGCLIKKQ
jgi:peroxiredoxin